MNKGFFIYDVGPQENLEWLTTSFTKRNINYNWLAMNYNVKDRLIKWRKIFLFYNYLELAIRSLRKSKKDDYLVNWNFIIGAMTVFFMQTVRY